MNRRLNGKQAVLLLLAVSFLWALVMSVVPARADDDDKPADQQAVKLDEQMMKFYSEKRYDDAIVCGNKLLKLHPDDGRVWYNVGCLNALAGHKDEAFNCLNKAVAKGFTEADQYKSDDDLTSIRKDKRFAELMGKLSKDDDSDEKDEADKPRDKDHDADDDDEKPGEHEEEDVVRRGPSADGAKFQQLTQQMMKEAEAGHDEKALKLAEEALELAKKNPGLAKAVPIAQYNVACMHSRMKHTDEACENLKKAVAGGFTDVAHMNDDSDLDNIRKEPCYKAILAGIKKGDKDEDDEESRGESHREPSGGGEKHETKMHVTLPSEYDADKPAPLIVALHGAGGNLRHATDEWEDAADRFGAILLTPQGTEEHGGPDGFAWSHDIDRVDAAVTAAIEAVSKRHKVDRRHVVVVGFSQGAWAAYHLALRHPDQYCGVIPVAGQFDETLEELASGHKLEGMRAYIMVGEDDPLAKGNKRGAKVLKKAGAKVKFKEFDDLGHSYPKSRVKEEEKALKFVLGKDADED